MSAIISPPKHPLLVKIMQNTLDVYNSYEQNYTRMINMSGKEDTQWMVMILTGPWSCAKAVSEFFGYTFF